MALAGSRTCAVSVKGSFPLRLRAFRSPAGSSSLTIASALAPTLKGFAFSPPACLRAAVAGFFWPGE